MNKLWDRVKGQMRILHVTRQYLDIHHGGVESHIYELARAQIALGHEVLVVRVSNEQSVQTPPSDVPFLHVPMLRGRAQVQGLDRGDGALASLKDRLSANFKIANSNTWSKMLSTYDVVHFHDFLAVIRLSRSASREASVFWTNHLGEFLAIAKLPLGGLLLRVLTSHFDAAFGPSRELSRQHMIGCKVQYIPNGVDTERFQASQDKAKLKQRLGFGSETKILLVPRRWAPNKGVLGLVEALAELEWPELVVVFVGAGSSGYARYREQIARALDEVRIPHRVVDSATTEEMVAWYQVADFTVIPSLMEATSLAALEAMAVGNVVLATPIGGLVEIINSPVDGILTSGTQAPQILEGLNRLKGLSDSDLQAISGNAIKKIQDVFSWVRIADQLSVEYRKSSDA